MSTQTRRTRFVCISDTHNCTVKLPKGDVLIHAGDMTNQGSLSELSKSVQWLEKADFEAKIVIAGNHDITLDKSFYAQHGQYFHNKQPQDPDECIALLEGSSSITYLCHEPATIQLTSPEGPRTKFTIFGSPFSPAEGMWAFGYENLDQGNTHESQTGSQPHGQLSSSGLLTRLPLPTGSDLWDQIPLNTDIVVSHTPPYTHCDESPSRRRAAGCEALRRRLWRVRPRLHVCGHVHEGRGAEVVRWDIDGGPGAANVAYPESRVECWQDPSADSASGKISLVDLTSRSRKSRLDNDGSHPSHSSDLACAHLHRDKSSGTVSESGPRVLGEICSLCFPRPPVFPPAAGDGPGDRTGPIELETPTPLAPEAEHPGLDIGRGSLGIGGDPATHARCDLEALLGRMGRRETCIINCAIAATSWPHAGGKKFNKPIVVDLDLPVSLGD